MATLALQRAASAAPCKSSHPCIVRGRREAIAAHTHQVLLASIGYAVAQCMHLTLEQSAPPALERKRA